MGDGRSHLLVVDDDPDILRLIERRLAARYDVTTASCGLEALTKISQRRPDLIVLDILLPDFDGITLTKLLRGDPETSSLPIILITAYDTSLNRAEGLNAGADDCLGKPFDASELLARITLLLRRARRGETGPLGEKAGPGEAVAVFRGIALSIVLQMFHLERRSCSLQITAASGVGAMTVVDGEIAAATDSEGIGEEAVYRMMTWQEPRTQVWEARLVSSPNVTTSLPALIMESVRREDEARNTGAATIMPRTIGTLTEDDAADDLVRFLPPKALLEAVNAGTAVITSQTIGALREYDSGNDVARFLPPRSSLIEESISTVAVESGELCQTSVVTTLVREHNRLGMGESVARESDGPCTHAVDIVAVEQLDRVSNDETVMVGEIASSAADHADVANPAIEPLNPAAIRTALKQARVITGFLVGAIVDQASGVAREATMVTNPATFGLDFELAGRMNASWLAQILALYGRLGHGDLPDDIVVSTPLQLHLIHSIPGPAGAFLYLVFDRKVVNLALMQRMVNEIARTLVESME